MNHKIATLKIKDLINILKDFNPELDVFISVDSEGNGYGTIDESMSFSALENNKAIVIYPFGEGIDHDDLIDSYDK